MPIATGNNSGQMNPWAAGAMGAGAGVAGYAAVDKIRKANTKANWALGIGVVLTGLAFISSSDLNAAQNTATSLQGQAQALVIDTTNAASVGAGLNALRNITIGLAQNQATIAYDANWFALNGPPPAATLAGTTLSGALYPAAVQTVTTTTSNNNVLIVMALAVVVVLALVL